MGFQGQGCGSRGDIVYEEKAWESGFLAECVRGLGEEMVGPRPAHSLRVGRQLCKEKTEVISKSEGQIVGPGSNKGAEEEGSRSALKAVSGGELQGLVLIVDDRGPPLVSKII